MPNWSFLSRSKQPSELELINRLSEKEIEERLLSRSDALTEKLGFGLSIERLRVERVSSTLEQAAPEKGSYEVYIVTNEPNSRKRGPAMSYPIMELKELLGITEDDQLEDGVDSDTQLEQELFDREE